MVESSADLTDITGVGASVASDLEEAGFESVEAVATATLDELESVSTYMETRAESIREGAKELVDADEDDEELLDVDETLEELDDVDLTDVVSPEEGAEMAEDAVDSMPDSAPTTDGPESFEVSVEVTHDLFPHYMAAIIEEATRGRQRSMWDDEAVLLDVMYDTMDRRAEIGDADVYTFTYEVTMDELNLLHQGLSSRIEDYRSRAGLPKLWGDLRAIKDQLNDHRKANHGK